jgi:hypothetical protein
MEVLVEILDILDVVYLSRMMREIQLKNDSSISELQPITLLSTLRHFLVSNVPSNSGQRVLNFVQIVNWLLNNYAWNYKVKNPELKKIFSEIGRVVEDWWWEIAFTHVFREQNTEADRLSNVAMDKKN